LRPKLIEPNLSRQCWLFAIGSALFAVATAPRFSVVAGAGATNSLCFLGSWFFTTAAWMQLRLAADSSRLEWHSASSQFTGTVLFNISTGAALVMQSVTERRRLVWTPDVAGSLAFLVSGVLAVAALVITSAIDDRQAPNGRRDRAIAVINMAGCVAFGLSAGAAFVRISGVTEDQWLANIGTFVGALCFLIAALLALPRFRKQGGALRQSPA
jgi:hypothetical protein